MWDESLVLGTRSFRSRLVVGAERYPSAEIMRRSHEAAGAELVTIALRELQLASAGGSLLASIDQNRFTLIATTSGCRTADEAVRTAYLAREAGLGEIVAIDVVGDSKTEMPDLAAVLHATRTLGRDGFVTVPVAGDDPVAARRLEEAGATGILLQPAPVGLGLGIRNPYAVPPRPGRCDRAGHRGRRSRHRLGRGPRDGAWVPRRAGRDDHRRGAGSGGDGRGDAPRSGGRPRSYKAGRIARRLHRNPVPRQNPVRLVGERDLRWRLGRL